MRAVHCCTIAHVHCRYPEDPIRDLGQPGTDHVVHAPLTAVARTAFDADAASAFFLSQESLDYGYPALLVGWLGTLDGNYPCLPPADPADEPFCLTVAAVGSGCHLQGGVEQPRGGLRHRPGVCGLPRAAGGAAEGGGDEAARPTRRPVRWSYSQVYNNGTRTMGASMVCDVFVCRMWKAGGLCGKLPGGTGGAVNCGELTNWDVYVLDLVAAPAERPAACVAADPDNALCQIVGGHKMGLNDLGKKVPYAPWVRLPRHRPELHAAREVLSAECAVCRSVRSVYICGMRHAACAATRLTTIAPYRYSLLACCHARMRSNWLCCCCWENL